MGKKKDWEKLTPKKKKNYIGGQNGPQMEKPPKTGKKMA
jgi:hypothetical protein